MFKICIVLICFLTSLSFTFANDGGYNGSGETLFPIHEDIVSLKKEVLTITKRGLYAYVDVYYELYNPGKEKEIIVGFEAECPSGGVDHHPASNGGHPYMDKFSVIANNKKLNYTINYILSDESLDSNQRSISLKKLLQYFNNNEEFNQFMYVYTFKMRFKKGKNIINHRYRYELSTAVDIVYSFSYNLEPANRWANKQIDDFTLILDLGNDEAVQLSLGTDTIEYIDLTEQQRQQIRFTGDGYLASVSNDSTDYWPRGGFLENVFIRHGKMIYNQKNFKPPKSLRFVSFAPHLYERNEESFKYFIPFSKSAWFYFIENGYHLNGEIESEVFCKEIMKNIPLARKGYEFKDEYFNELFSKHTNWYRPKEKNK
jgi:hypothetical protein